MNIKLQSTGLKSSEPLYLQLCDVIRGKIENQEMCIGQKIPTIRDFCKEFGVSICTAREAVAKLVDDGYLYSRRKQGTYVINKEAKKTVDLERKNEICFIICTGAIKETFESRSFYELISSVGEQAARKQLHLLFKTVDETDKELDFGRKIKDIAGLIVAGNITPKHMKLVKKTGLPFVMLGDVFGKGISIENADVITTNDFQNTYLATKYLIDSGSRRIIYAPLYLGKFSWNKNEFSGYRKALEDAGINYDKDLIVEIGNDKPGAMKSFLEKSVNFDALACVDLGNVTFDLMMNAFSLMNIKPPEKIVSAGGVKLPGIIEVNPDIYQTGKTAVERLYKRLTNPAWKPERILIPGKLIGEQNA